MNANGNSFAIFPFRLRLKAKLGIGWNVLENCDRHKLSSLSFPSEFYFSVRIFRRWKRFALNFSLFSCAESNFFIISDGKLLF